MRARDLFNGITKCSTPVFLSYNNIRAKVNSLLNGYWLRRVDMNFQEILNNQNYIGFNLYFHIPSEWIENCLDIERLSDFLILAAGVRRYSLFNDNPIDGDEYFLEHLNIVVEVKEVGNYTFLMQRRPDITTLVGEGFDFDIIDSEAVHTEEMEEMEQGNKTWGQTDIQFNNINPNDVLAIEAPNEEEDEEMGNEEEKEELKRAVLSILPPKEEEEVEEGEVVEKMEEKEPLNLIIKKEPEEVKEENVEGGEEY
ncbi:uncharacterized protein LOC122501900 [Leptopilina heterotoma]|uniref:uncharacterized protein LOC122501900 n=1 Tax=Leptopilina heterotoma TaxID=63436 RepID=UPI001CA80B23|nr:uncharacterized protein LOC122501900 [Leptopilina heterotoma]